MYFLTGRERLRAERRREYAGRSKSWFGLRWWIKGLGGGEQEDDRNHLLMIASPLLSHFNHLQHPNDATDFPYFYETTTSYNNTLGHEIQIDENSQGYWSFSSLSVCLSFSIQFCSASLAQKIKDVFSVTLAAEKDEIILRERVICNTSGLAKGLKEKYI